jgi:hypothetical protein
MIAALASPAPPDSNHFARSRDARVCWLLSHHPVTAAILAALGWFPSAAKASKRLRRLVGRRKIRLVGTVCRKPGRPEHVFCRSRPKSDHLLHEIELTELCLRLDAGRIVRNPAALNRQLRPDAEVWINGRHYYLENDRGTMGYAQIQRRFRLYEATQDFVLWVCSTPDRCDAFRARAEGIRAIALFTTMAEALSDPHGPIWTDVAGGRASLPREGAGKAA